MKKSVLAMLAASISAIAYAGPQIQTENAKGITWSFSISENGASITSGQIGKPAIPTSVQGDVSIPYLLGGKSVVEIGDDAFHGCSAIASIKIPLTVERIGARAFYDCFSIKELNVPRKCTELGEQAFKGMTRLEKVLLKGAIADIPDRLFEKCESLEDVEFGKGTVNVVGQVFYGCKQLRKVVFPSTLRNLAGGNGDNGMFKGVRELREVVFNGPPPEMDNVGFPEKCVIRYDDQFARRWQEWKEANPSIAAFSGQGPNANEGAGTGGGQGSNSAGVDDKWLAIVETNVVKVSDEKDARNRIEKLASGELDLDLAAKWFALVKSMNVTNSSERTVAGRLNAIREPVLQTAAVALICVGKSAVFKTELAPMIANLKDFEDMLRSPCEACGNAVDGDDIFARHGEGNSGGGKVKVKCQSCHGTGRCSYQGCDGGNVEIRKRKLGNSLQPSESYVAGYRKCTSCSWTGECRYCKGKGYLLNDCPKCGGKGWAITRKHLGKIYRETAEEALAVARDAVERKERDERNGSSPSLPLPEVSFSHRLYSGGRDFVRNHVAKNKNCRIVAITKRGGDVVVSGDNDWASSSCPVSLNRKLQQISDQDEKIIDVCLTELGSFIVLYGGNSAAWSGIPQGMERKLREYNSNYEKLYSASFNDAGDWIVVSDKHYSCSATWIREWLKDGEMKFGELLAATVSTDAAVAVYAKGFKFFGNVPDDLMDALRRADFYVRIIKIAGSSWFFADRTGYRYNYKM